MIQSIKMWKLALLVIIVIAVTMLNGCGAKGDLVLPDDSAKAATTAPAEEAQPATAEAQPAATEQTEEKSKSEEAE